MTYLHGTPAGFMDHEETAAYRNVPLEAVTRWKESGDAPPGEYYGGHGWLKKDIDAWIASGNPGPR